MVDYGATISLSRGLSHSSDDGSSELSPGSGPNLSTPVTDDVPAPPPAKRRKASGSDEYHQNLQSPAQTVGKVRGRPPGSKNKPKPPVIITRESESSMKPAILEISAGCDIIESIINFARKNHVGVSVIGATGSVSNVTIRNPVSHHHHSPSHPVSNVTIRNPVPHHSAAPLFFRGPVTLLALSGSFFGSFATTQSGPPSSSPSSSSSLGPVHACSSFGVSLAGVQGHVFGGIVAGKMVAATPVMVVVATFLSPTFHMLPVENNEADKDVDIMPSLGGAGAAAAGGSAIERCASTGLSSMPAYAASSPAPISCSLLPSHQIVQWGPPGRPPF